MNYYSVESMKQDANRYHYVFIGQNATTGQPHHMTGKMSYYGNIICFKYKEDAKRYVNEFRSNNSSEFAIAGTVNTLRKYKQGQSWHNYLSDLLLNDALTYDDKGELC